MLDLTRGRNSPNVAFVLSQRAIDSSTVRWQPGATSTDILNETLGFYLDVNRNGLPVDTQTLGMLGLT